jgi:hypothetical protein
VFQRATLVIVSRSAIHRWLHVENMSVQSLVARIEQVFPELPLPDMTLRQAQLLDETLDREISQEEWDATGRIDRGVVWKDIEPAALIGCDAALSHMSEAGFVYYIPAYMRLALNQLAAVVDPHWESFGSIVFQLTDRSNYSLARFKRFSDMQIDTVIGFLRQIRAAGGFEGKMAEEALGAYWETSDARQPKVILVS